MNEMDFYMRFPKMNEMEAPGRGASPREERDYCLFRVMYSEQMTLDDPTDFDWPKSVTFWLNAAMFWNSIE